MDHKQREKLGNKICAREKERKRENSLGNHGPQNDSQS